MDYIEFKNINALGFQNHKHYYIYDSFSNQILKVEPIILKVLDDSFELNKEQIIEKYSRDFSKSLILDALESIKEIQHTNKALLSFKIPKFSICKQQTALKTLTENLNNNLTQLILNVTEDCNLACEYCVYSGNYINRRKHNKSNNITENCAKQAIDFFCSHTTNSKDKYISLYGGEPFLRFKFVKEIVEYTKKIDSDINFTITSNGTLLNERIIEFLDNNNISLTISLDGPKELHDSYRVYQNGMGTFETVMSKIELIKEKFPTFYSNKLKINSVVSPYNGEIKEISHFFNTPSFDFLKDSSKYSLGLINPAENKFVKEHDYDNYIISFFYTMFKEFLASHITSNELSNINISKSLFIKQIKMLYFRSNRLLSEYDYYWPNGICIPGTRSLFVSSKGKFYPCEKLYDYEDMVIGDIESGFNFNRVSEIINEYCDITIKDCRKCWAYRLCGECFLNIRENKSWDTKKRNQFCNGQRNMWVCILKIYTTILEHNSNAFDYFINEYHDKYEYVNETIKESLSFNK